MNRQEYLRKRSAEYETEQEEFFDEIKMLTSFNIQKPVPNVERLLVKAFSTATTANLRSYEHTLNSLNNIWNETFRPRTDEGKDLKTGYLSILEKISKYNEGNQKAIDDETRVFNKAYNNFKKERLIPIQSELLKRERERGEKEEKNKTESVRQVCEKCNKSVILKRMEIHLCKAPRDLSQVECATCKKLVRKYRLAEHQASSSCIAPDKKIYKNIEIDCEICKRKIKKSWIEKHQNSSRCKVDAVAQKKDLSLKIKCPHCENELKQYSLRKHLLRCKN